ncbi:MAG TPA: Mur ligase family protein, partial [Candidatus Micrarchaeia archaeon]|nr:Mur ligase family protein [Candidatus Micrarchaeia archaeon]
GHDLAPAAELGAAFDRAHAGLPRALRAERRAALLAGVRDLRLGDRYLAGIAEATVAVATQAWFLHPRNRVLQELVRAGLPLYGLAQAYLDCAEGLVIGVSGSHGKSTTAALVAALARRSPRFTTVRLAGNDRHHVPCLVEAATGEATDALVLEVSNRQLLQMETAPPVACLTNVTPNHLDEHGGLDGYVAVKRRLFELPGNRVAVRNGDDPLSRERCPAAATAKEWRFAAAEAGLGVCDGAFEGDGAVVVRREGLLRERIPLHRLQLSGDHNRANVRAAVATLAAVTELPPTAEAALAAFSPLRHRTQLVWQEAGVDWLDDLNSTTPQSTLAAIRAAARPLVLLCGGEDKGLDFSELAQTVPDPVRRVVLLPGPGSDRIAQALTAAGRGALVDRVATLDEAVARAAAAAAPGQVVLFSPACPGVFHTFYGPDPGGRGFRAALRSRRAAPTSPPRRRGPA